jgi:hypothetical protein
MCPSGSLPSFTTTSSRQKNLSSPIDFEMKGDAHCGLPAGSSGGSCLPLVWEPGPLRRYGRTGLGADFYLLSWQIERSTRHTDVSVRSTRVGSPSDRFYP